MNTEKVLADFQFAGNRICKYSIETKNIDTNGNSTKTDYNIDYNILDITQDDDKIIGIIEFTVDIKAKVNNSLLFKIALKIEGIFLGNPNKLDKEKFTSMLELNGTATLSQIARSYILANTALSGLNPPIKLPMINIHSLKKLKNKEINDKKRVAK